jgi:hypothetical protein
MSIASVASDAAAEAHDDIDALTARVTALEEALTRGQPPKEKP